jgi:membrane protease YdiL (CAAX protease family)
MAIRDERLRCLAVLIRFLRSYPVASFALLAFALAYGVGLPVQIALAVFLPQLDATVAHYAGRVFVVSAPALAALILALTAGHGRTQRWICQLRPTAAAMRWLPIAIVGFMAISAIAFLLEAHSIHDLRTVLAQAWPRLLLILLLEIMIVGIGEELGWRGWLLPTLLARGWSPLGASLGVGALWAAWHVPILVQGPAVALAFVVTAVGLSVLQTALWLRTTGSVMVAAAAHAAFNAPFETFPGVGWASVALVTTVAALTVASVAFKKMATDSPPRPGSAMESD